jgi:hypothetical protein
MSDNALRARIDQRLREGLATDWQVRAGGSHQVAALCRRLQALPAGAIDEKLVVAGFTLEPYVDPADADGIEQSCATCMYFERHRQFCDLPELMLPVEPTWSCALWRI